MISTMQWRLGIRETIKELMEKLTDKNAGPDKAVSPGVDSLLQGTNEPEKRFDASLLQNRDRGRDSYILQMKKIADNPDYDRISTSKTPDTGAPMVFVRGTSIPSGDAGRVETITMSDGKDGTLKIPSVYAVIEAKDAVASHTADGVVNKDYGGDNGIMALNNGRTASLKRAYSQDTANQYKAALKADTANHGVSVAAIEAMKEPVLVRVFQEADIAHLEDPGTASNVSAGATLAASEQAESDARRIDSKTLTMFQGGDIHSSGNRDFVRSFISAMGEAGDMTTHDGALSAVGVNRIKGALVAKAYNDPAILTDITENMDDDLKSLANVLTDVAGRWSLMSEAAADGHISPAMDITDNLTAAITLVRKSRQSGKSLNDLVGQTDLFAGKIDPVTESILNLLYKGENFSRVRSAEVIKRALNGFLDRAMATTPGADMFGDTITPGQLLNAENDTVSEAENAKKAQGGLFDSIANYFDGFAYNFKAVMDSIDSSNLEARAKAKLEEIKTSGPADRFHRELKLAIKQNEIAKVVQDDYDNGIQVIYVTTKAGHKERQVRKWPLNSNAFEKFDNEIQRNGKRRKEIGESGVYREICKHSTHVKLGNLFSIAINDDLSDAGKKTNTNPTEKQKESGHYKKGRTTIHGLRVAIENPKGSIRSGKNASGKAWQSTMNAHYGYFERTTGADGDEIDVFFGPNSENFNPKIYVINQVDNDGVFDEHKVMFGYSSARAARNGYLGNYEKGWSGLGSIKAISLKNFKLWLKSNKTKSILDELTLGQDMLQVVLDSQDELFTRRLKKMISDSLEKLKTGNLSITERLKTKEDIELAVEELETELEKEVKEPSLNWADNKAVKSVQAKMLERNQRGGGRSVSISGIAAGITEEKDPYGIQNNYSTNNAIRDYVDNQGDDLTAQDIDALLGFLNEKIASYQGLSGLPRDYAQRYATELQEKKAIIGGVNERAITEDDMTFYKESYSPESDFMESDKYDFENYIESRMFADRVYKQIEENRGTEYENSLSHQAGTLITKALAKYDFEDSNGGYRSTMYATRKAIDGKVTVSIQDSGSRFGAEKKEGVVEIEAGYSGNNLADSLPHKYFEFDGDESKIPSIASEINDYADQFNTIVDVKDVPEYGSLYADNSNLSATEISKALRTAYKGAIKSGKIPEGVKISVKTKGYSSIDITVKELPSSIPLFSDKYIDFIKREGENYSTLPSNISMYSAEYRALRTFLKSHADAYNYNNDDLMTDYHDSNFYLSVDSDYDLRQAEREKAMQAYDLNQTAQEDESETLEQAMDRLNVENGPGYSPKEMKNHIDSVVSNTDGLNSISWEMLQEGGPEYIPGTDELNDATFMYTIKTNGADINGYMYGNGKTLLMRDGKRLYSLISNDFEGLEAALVGASGLDEKSSNYDSLMKNNPTYALKARPFSSDLALAGKVSLIKHIPANELPDSVSADVARHGVIIVEKALSQNDIEAHELVAINASDPMDQSKEWKRIVAGIDLIISKGLEDQYQDDSFFRHVKLTPERFDELLEEAGYDDPNDLLIDRRKIARNNGEGDVMQEEPKQEVDVISNQVSALRDMPIAEYESKIDALLEDIEAAGRLEEFEELLTEIDESRDSELRGHLETKYQQ